MISVKKIVRNQVLEKNLVFMILINKYILFFYLHSLIFYIYKINNLFYYNSIY